MVCACKGCRLRARWPLRLLQAAEAHACRCSKAARLERRSVVMAHARPRNLQAPSPDQFPTRSACPQPCFFSQGRHASWYTNAYMHSGQGSEATKEEGASSSAAFCACGLPSRVGSSESPSFWSGGRSLEGSPPASSSAVAMKS